MDAINLNSHSEPSVMPNIATVAKTKKASSFKPDEVNARAYRNALGQFGTGVTVITTATEQGPIGMTVNSFSSVSLSPALVLWSLANKSGRFLPFRQALHYSIHVLREDQSELATAFSRDATAFGLCDWRKDANNVPLISDSLTRFDCTQHATHQAGDHTIIIGQVQNVETSEGVPLMFAQGGFGEFQLTQ